MCLRAFLHRRQQKTVHAHSTPHLISPLPSQSSGTLHRLACARVPDARHVLSTANIHLLDLPVQENSRTCAPVRCPLCLGVMFRIPDARGADKVEAVLPQLRTTGIRDRVARKAPGSQGVGIVDPRHELGSVLRSCCTNGTEVQRLPYRCSDNFDLAIHESFDALT